MYAVITFNFFNHHNNYIANLTCMMEEGSTIYTTLYSLDYSLFHWSGIVYHIVQQDEEGCLHVHSYTLHHTVAPQYYIQCSKFSCSVKCSSTWLSPRQPSHPPSNSLHYIKCCPLHAWWRGVLPYGPLLIGSQPLSLIRYCTVSSSAAKWRSVSILISTLYITVSLFH